MERRLRVGVVYGGRSGEHEISLRSAAAIIAHLDPDRYEVVPIAIAKDGQWLTGPESLQVLETAQRTLSALPAHGAPVTITADPTRTGLLPIDTDAAPSSGRGTARRSAAAPSRGRGAAGRLGAASSSSGDQVVASRAIPLDVVFPVLHGTYGEDGTIQGLLELADVPYVGAGVLASAVGMDKAIMKSVFRDAGLPVCAWLVTSLDEDVAALRRRIDEAFGFPCFVKPANLGSSVGIAKAGTPADLTAAVAEAAAYDPKIIVEEAIDCREFECAVLGNEHPEASVVGELVPSHEFYDYADKYVDAGAQVVIPAAIPTALSDEIRALALRAFRAIDCSGLARVDFFVERATTRVLVNEINTMPGFTAISMYPKLWDASGTPFAELLDRLIALAQDRHAARGRRRLSFTPPAETKAAPPRRTQRRG
jgi:D-alanine-D-alanine ligase